ncbi:MAG TPA: hypothetical protein VK921_12390 [Anditalea sp.]|nr:hypothetical protein [Anditalea sp.]
MKLLKPILIAVPILICSFSFSHLDPDPITVKILSFFKRAQEEYPVEKVYLHLDKFSYTLGEDVWFSAYMTAGSDLVPSLLSKVLYVDFFNADGLLLGQKKVKMEEGLGYGDLQIPQFGMEGIYKIKAYTAWMENFGPDYFFEQEINVYDATLTSFLPQIDFTSMHLEDGKVKYQVNMVALDHKGNELADKSIGMKVIIDGDEVVSNELLLNYQGEVSFGFSIPEEPHKVQYLELSFQENEDYRINKKIQIPYSFSLADIQFMPEGGDLIAGFKSNIAFKGIYPDGSPADFEGLLLGLEEETKIATHFGGMGKFSLTPELEGTHKIKVWDPRTGIEQLLDLPKAKKEGLTVQVVNNPLGQYVTVFIQGNIDEKELTLVSQTRGIINYMIKGNLINGIWGVRIPKDNLLSGINQITVLSASGQPILERLFFMDFMEEHIEVGVLSLNEISKRGEVVFNINSTIDSLPIAGNYSISVTDANQVTSESNAKGQIFSHLLLTSDLKGNIYQPGYYFKDREPETLEALDLVMMTNGWSRFTWNDVLENTFPSIERYIEQGIIIKGSIENAEDRWKDISGGTVTAIIGDLGVVNTTYEQDGAFILPPLDYMDTVMITLTAKDKRKREFVNISMDSPKFYFEAVNPKYPGKMEFPINLLAGHRERDLLRQMLDSDKYLELEGVTIKAQSIDKEEMAKRKPYGDGEISINPADISGSAGFANIFQMIQGRVAGVQIVITAQQDVLVTIRGSSSIQGGSQPLFMIDNMFVDARALLAVNVQDVASVDIFKDPAQTAMFGSRGTNGVIAVYTKSGGGLSSASSKGKIMSRIEGYSNTKEFYSPRYDIQNPTDGIADRRTTLYWNPKLKIEENGQIEVRFFNSDFAKEYLVVIEGMDTKGRLARYEGIIN